MSVAELRFDSTYDSILAYSNHKICISGDEGYLLALRNMIESSYLGGSLKKNLILESRQQFHTHFATKMTLDVLQFLDNKGGNAEEIRESQRKRGHSVEIVDEVIQMYADWVKSALHH